tara:strand:+ start:331 stop:567 length:237 start_codon:yes stop_codon:yes gene_type:complete
LNARSKFESFAELCKEAKIWQTRVPFKNDNLKNKRLKVFVFIHFLSTKIIKVLLQYPSIVQYIGGLIDLKEGRLMDIL